MSRAPLRLRLARRACSATPRRRLRAQRLARRRQGARLDRRLRRRRAARVHRRLVAADRRALPRPAAGRRQRAAVRDRAGHAGLDRRGDARRHAGLLARAAGGRTTPSRSSAGPRLRALRAWVGRARLPARPLRAHRARACRTTSSTTRPGSRRSRWRVRAATAIGCAPRAFAYTALGGSLDNLGSPEAIVAIVRPRRDGRRRPARCGAATCARRPTELGALDLEQARRPGRPLGRPAVMPTRWPRLAPAELDDARGRRRRSAPR